MNLPTRCRRGHSAFLAAAAALTLCALCFPAVSSAAIRAADVLRTAGKDQGLCVIVGCGDQSDLGLAAELAKTGKMVVHGIALDDAALARAQKAITAAGVDGLATVERLPLQPLPYRDNLVTLLVVLNPQRAAAAGFSQAEALRVTAPFGQLLVYDGQSCRATVKPMPSDMDQWTHENHGPDGNTISRDKVVHFPVGFRWNAGLPMNLQHPQQTANAWSSTRGIALCGGRCFTLSSSVWENLGPIYKSQHGVDQYVTARDAFNGMLLWRQKIGATYYGGLYYPNRAPFVAVGNCVYVTGEDGKLLALDVASGAVTRKFATTHAPGRILVDQGVLVTANWKEGTRVGGLSGVDRRLMDFAIGAGTVEAFDAQNGNRLWKLDTLATSVCSADGILFMVQRQGADKREEASYPPRPAKTEPPPRPEQFVVAVELHSGQPLWEARVAKPGANETLRVDAAGLGVVTVAHNNGARTSILSAKDGRLLSTVSSGSFTALHEGAIHLGGKKYDPATGASCGSSTVRLGGAICTPHYFVNDILVQNRGGGFVVDGKTVVYGGARGACLFASIPAYGAFYTAQNWCGCAPAQIPGFIAFGPIAHDPTVEEMQQPTAVEPGPALAQAQPAPSPAQPSGDWPMFRHDPQRSNASAGAAPQKLDVLWQKTVVRPVAEGPIGADWREGLTDPLTPPVVADGMLVAAASDRNQVVALDAAGGGELWRRTIGGRVDSSPTIYRNLCLFGAHDGYVYAVSRADGQLAWRLRAAPREERMVSYGKVESPWPVVGTVMVAGGVAYASAGRTQGSDGGIVVRAMDAASGKLAWSKAIAPLPNAQQYREMRKNDLIVQFADSIQLMFTRMNPQTGEFVPNATHEFQKEAARVARWKQQQLKTTRKGQPAKPGEEPATPAPLAEIAPGIGLEGFVCGNWTRLGNRKYQAMSFGNLSGAMISWGDSVVAVNSRDGTSIVAVPRDQVQPAGQAPARKGPLWTSSLPEGHQATSVVVCRNAIVVGGGVYKSGSKQGQGFIQLLSLDAGQPTAECTLDAPLTYNGVAVAGGKIYATLSSGAVACVGWNP